MTEKFYTSQASNLSKWTLAQILVLRPYIIFAQVFNSNKLTIVTVVLVVFYERTR